MMTILFLGLGAAGGIGGTYLFTHPALRSALFSRLKGSVTAAAAKVQNKIDALQNAPK